MEERSGVPSYPKVLTVGSRHTENVFDGRVSVQEKVDGSQFGFGVDASGAVCCRSHHRQIALDEGPEAAGMFDLAAGFVAGRFAEWAKASGLRDSYFYAEYLRKPKQNTISYGRVPSGNLVLFDALVSWGKDTSYWLDYEHLAAIAAELGIDVVPLLATESNVSVDFLANFLSWGSYLAGDKGSVTVEGVVVKNYSQIIALGSVPQPLFCKHVNPKFQEANTEGWKRDSRKGRLESYLERFGTEAAWRKAVQHLDEAGELTHTPRDIGPLIKELSRDLEDEQSADIKDRLWEIFKRDILKAHGRGFPEWYKDQLAERLART